MSERLSLLTVREQAARAGIEISHIRERFAKYYTKSKKCWNWEGYLNDGGYGIFIIGARKFIASRVSFELANTNIDKTKIVLHTCDNPSCVNPKHLLLGSKADNLLDAKLKGRKRHPHKKNKYLGTHWRKDTLKWRAYVDINKTRIWLGCFDDEIKAAEVRDAEIIRRNLPGILNFPTT